VRAKRLELHKPRAASVKHFTQGLFNFTRPDEEGLTSQEPLVASTMSQLLVPKHAGRGGLAPRPCERAGRGEGPASRYALSIPLDRVFSTLRQLLDQLRQAPVKVPGKAGRAGPVRRGARRA
jgi:hypothetical protein